MTERLRSETVDALSGELRVRAGLIRDLEQRAPSGGVLRIATLVAGLQVAVAAVWLAVGIPPVSEEPATLALVDEIGPNAGASGALEGAPPSATGLPSAPVPARRSLGEPARDDEAAGAVLAVSSTQGIAEEAPADSPATLEEPSPPTSPPAPSAPECVAGTACSPNVVDGFPYRTRGDTRDAQDSQIAGYACAPSIDESGPEIWYQLDVPSAGVLRARLARRGSTAVDVDLHLLSEADPGACVARHDHQIRRVVTPGRYWLVLDSFAWPGEAPAAGAYDLRVSFRPR